MLHTTVSGTYPTEEVPISNKRHQYRTPSINALCLNRSNQTRKPNDACESPTQLRRETGAQFDDSDEELDPAPHMYLIRIQNRIIWVRYPWLGIETQRTGKGRVGV